MPKRNWNDIDDSDSSLSSLSDREDAPAIEKRLSAPPASSKLKDACDEMSLRRLEKHEGSEVWLYIPNSFYEMADEVDHTLARRQQLKKITRINLGWNVLASRQDGRALIEQGIAEERFFIKFIYSSRNEERGMNGEDRPAKLQKKVTYVEKNTKPAEKEEVAEETKVELKSSANEADRNKKKKWVEKSKSMNSEEAKSNITSQEELRSPRKEEAEREEQKGGNNWPSTVKSPNKYATEEPRSPRRFKEREAVQAKEPSKIEPQPKEANEAKGRKSQAGSDSELSQQKQQRKKKKKKTQKKSKPPGKATKGDQNPFSYFME